MKESPYLPFSGAWAPQPPVIWASGRRGALGRGAVGPEPWGHGSLGKGPGRGGWFRYLLPPPYVVGRFQVPPNRSEGWRHRSLGG